MKKTNEKEETTEVKNKKKGTSNDNTKRKITKASKKAKVVRKSVADEKGFELTPEMNKALWTAFVVLLVLLVFYFIASIKSDYEPPKSNDKEKTTIQYTEILAGSSFNRKESEYLVVYYDMSDSENEDTTSINSTISSYTNSSATLTLYTCDLSSSFNKLYVTTNEPNTNPVTAEDLLINGPTIIKFSGGKVIEYVYGKNEVENYLNGLSSN